MSWLEQEIANEDRQLRRLTDRLAKLDDTHLDAVLAKAEEMGRQLAAKREQLRELQRACRRPKVKSIKEKDVVAALTQLRDLLQGDVGIAAQVLKALVGDVILETRQVEGKAKPQYGRPVHDQCCAGPGGVRVWQHRRNGRAILAGGLQRASRRTHRQDKANRSRRAPEPQMPSGTR